MPRDETVLLFVGIKGSVVALDRATGNERWRTKLKGMSFVSLHRDDRYLYASTRGELFCPTRSRARSCGRTRSRGSASAWSRC